MSKVFEKGILGSSEKEAYAYTPGLKVKKAITIKKVRRLPLHGDVLVNKGDEVGFDSVVARVKVPGRPHIVKASRILNVDSDELRPYLVKKVGDKVTKGDVIAKCISLFGLIKKFVKSPVDGTIDSISDITGRITVREESVPVEVDAYIPGKVVEVFPSEGVIIETDATFIQGIFGIGGESHGEITMLAESPEDILTVEKITSEHKGKILITGALVTGRALRSAVENEVTGIVSGGIKEEELIDFIGHPIGVAITGEEEVGITLVITEGFGKMTMSRRIFNLFKEFEGYLAHINGATQIRAGVLRPEIIIPHRIITSEREETTLDAGMKPGTSVRLIQYPYFGKIGTVINLPVSLQKIETGSDVRVVEVKLENDEHVIVPRANVEIIEE